MREAWVELSGRLLLWQHGWLRLLLWQRVDGVASAVLALPGVPSVAWFLWRGFCGGFVVGSEGDDVNFSCLVAFQNHLLYMYMYIYIYIYIYLLFFI